jgi:hypothetical protein
MAKHENSYLLSRAEEEIKKAQQSSDPRAVSANLLSFTLTRLTPSPTTTWI